MNKEIQSIIRNLKNTLNGEPWYGRAVFPILEEADESKVYVRPGGTQHSLAELLYHMITWSEFSLKQLENASEVTLKEIEKKDWREFDPEVHTWKIGLEEFKSINEKIITILETKEDLFLKERAPGREFNFRYMLNGLIQHHIYHLGQIAFIIKLQK